ncbi:hypothetical protein FRB91_000698, partial [Serendipita sp. 411]
MSSNSTAPPLDDPAAQAAAQAAAAAAIAALLDLAKQITLGRYFAGVALTLAVYDWIILFERESQCVWNTRWRWTKGIYYYNRIVSLIGLGITVLETTDQWTSELSVTVRKPHSWCRASSLTLCPHPVVRIFALTTSFSISQIIFDVYFTAARRTLCSSASSSGPAFSGVT